MLFFYHFLTALGTADRVARRPPLVGHSFPAAGADAVTTGAGARAVAAHSASSWALSGGRIGSISSRHIDTSN